MSPATPQEVDEQAISDEPLRPMNRAVEEALTQNRHSFLRFLARRLGDESAAEDVLQSFCLRAVSKGTELRDSESAIAWLYSVLRSVLMDHYRSEAARRGREANYAQQQTLLGAERDEIELKDCLCNCFRGLLPTLRPDYAEVLRRVDLSGEPRDRVAADLGITQANMRVRLHRGRQALRTALGECCGSCCEQSFRDCSCDKGHGKATSAPSNDISSFYSEGH